MRIGAIFDLDGTIIDNSSEREFVKWVLRSWKIPLGNWIRWSATLVAKRSLVAAKSNKVYLRNQCVEQIQQNASELFRNALVSHISPRAEALIAEHKRQGHLTLLLSGSLELFVQLFREHLGMDGHVGFRLEMKDGRFTGQTLGIQPYASGKADLLKQLATEYDLDLSGSYAYGNHTTDAAILELVGHPVAVNPDRGLLETAQSRGWEVEWFHGKAKDSW